MGQCFCGQVATYRSLILEPQCKSFAIGTNPLEKRNISKLSIETRESLLLKLFEVFVNFIERVYLYAFIALNEFSDNSNSTSMVV
jgi:hypothetical protein